MEGSLELIGNGLVTAVRPGALVFTILGVALGMVFGAMPGLSAFTALAVLLPFTFSMSPEEAVILFIAIYVGSQFGNSIPAVLIRTPGTPASVMIALEGHTFQKQGKGAQALGLSLVSSMWGQLFSFIGVALLLLPLARFAVRFIHPEVFALAVFGLIAAGGLVGSDPVKGLFATVFGLALATIGPDPINGTQRFTLGLDQLRVGLQPIPVIIGLLVVAELLSQSADDFEYEKPAGDLRRAGRILPSAWEIGRISRVTWIGSVVGFITGMIPGLGAAAGSFIAYQQSKIFAHEPERFGSDEGSIEAVAAADAANNAATGAEFIPTLGLGIPGGPAMVLVLAALNIHGIVPGPGLFRSAPGPLEAAIGGLFTASIAMGVLGYAAIRPSVFLVSLSREAVIMIALLTSLIGVYALRFNLFDVGVALVTGLIGLLLARFHYPMAPAALGYILGEIVESSLRRGLVLSFNDPLRFILRPYVLAIFGIGIAMATYTIWSRRRIEESAGERALEDALAD